MKLLTIALTSSTLILSGCMGLGGTKENTASNIPAAPECLFTDGSNQKAPGWVCDQPVPGLAKQATACVYSGGDSADRKKVAQAEAINLLAAGMKADVEYLMQSYFEETGVRDANRIEKVRKSVSNNLSTAALRNTPIRASMLSPNQEYCILIGLSSDQAESVVRKAVKTSMGSDEHLYQQWKGEKAQDMLADEIAKRAAMNRL